MTIPSATSVPKEASLAPLIDPYREKIERALQSALLELGELPMYGMLSYFLGHKDEKLSPREIPAGKRIRPALFLYANEAFGGSPSAMEFAVAIELFHNFTLIHDDIEDGDELRRGRKTVWKVWGINHAINAGDAQSLIAAKHLTHAVLRDPERAGPAALLLQQKFMEVTEGQYLDFELSTKKLDDPLVTKEAYLEMVRRKTSVLIGGAVAAGGIAAGCSEVVAKDLYEFGESLGLAYQITDDMASLWTSTDITGKKAYGDIYERKKSLPLIYAYAHSDKRKKLAALYAKEGSLSEEEVFEIMSMVTESPAYEFSKQEAVMHMHKAIDAAGRLPIAQKYKEALVGIVHAFVQFPKLHA